MRCKVFAIILLCLSLLSFKGDNNFIGRDGTDYAVFFAVKDYDQWDDLRTPIKDAKAIAKILREKYAFQTEILENPTWDQVMDKILNLKEKKFKKEDQLLFYFTGHGLFVPSKRDPTIGKGYFIPSDAKKDDKHRRSYIYYPSIKPEINDISCERILMVIDACYSGSFLKYRDGDERPGKLNQREKLISTVLKKRCRKGITSGGLERTKDGVHNSPFTLRFLTALNSEGGEDGILTNYELFARMDGLIPSPSQGYFGEEDMDSRFIFISKNKTLFEKGATTTNKSESKKQESTLESLKKDMDNWYTAAHINSIESYSQYLRKHPAGKFSGLAKRAISGLRSGKLNQVKTFNFSFDSPNEYRIAYAQNKAKVGADKAYKYLEAGRIKFPENLELLFDEINYYIGIKEYDQLIEKLEYALIKEPKNGSILFCLGSVYDGLMTNSDDENIKNSYYEASKKYYDMAVGLSPDKFDYQYGAGTIRYNKASNFTKEMIKLSDDFSKSGIKKYDLLKKQYLNLFEESLPFFQNAEAINPNDINTLTALKEIHSRLNDFSKSKIFADRLSQVKSGHRFSKSYFSLKKL